MYICNLTCECGAAGLRAVMRDKVGHRAEPVVRGTSPAVCGNILGRWAWVSSEKRLKGGNNKEGKVLHRG